MSTAVTLRGDRTPEASRSSPLHDIHTFAEAAYHSGLFKNVRSLHQAIVKISMGRELGISPMRAMQGIYIVQGNITMNGTLIGALIRQSGRYDYRVTRLTGEDCQIDFYAQRKEGEPQKIGTSTFTLDDARRAGLIGKDNWRSYPRNMLFNRAMSNGARWYCPDVFLGAVYTPDEMDLTVDSSGDVVEVVETRETPRETPERDDTQRALARRIYPRVAPEVAEEIKRIGRDPDVDRDTFTRYLNDVAATHGIEPEPAATTESTEAHHSQYEGGHDGP